MLYTYLREVTRPIPRVTYWRHAGLVKMEGKLLPLDGVHLKPEANGQLYKSMRSLIIGLIKSIRMANRQLDDRLG